MGYKTKQVKASFSDFERDYFVAQCKQSNSLYNCGVFSVRQSHFDVCELGKGWYDDDGLHRHNYRSKYASSSYPDLCSEFKENRHYRALGGQCAQQTLKSIRVRLRRNLAILLTDNNLVDKVSYKFL
jgi:putative transposase